MIVTIVKSNDPVRELIAVRYLNNRLIEAIADTYELLTGDDIFEPCMDKKKANILLEETVPGCYPKKKVFETYMRVFHMLMSDTVMSADPVSEYVISYALHLINDVVEPEGEYTHLALDSFIDRLKGYGLTEAEGENYKRELSDCMKELEGKTLSVLFEFDHYDKQLMDALTKPEIERMEKDFHRQITPLLDYLEAKKNMKTEEM